MAVGDTFEGLAEDAKKLPWWAWIAIGGVVFLVAKNYLGNQSASTPASSTPDSTGSVLDSSGGTTTPPSSTPPTSTPPSTPPPSTSSSGTPTPAPTPAPAPAPTRAYVVQSGDTLYAIAAREGVDEGQLYSQNQSIIESTARAHGFGSSDSGHWIFPGERLTVPA